MTTLLQLHEACNIKDSSMLLSPCCVPEGPWQPVFPNDSPQFSGLSGWIFRFPVSEVYGNARSPQRVPSSTKKAPPKSVS